MCPFVAYASAGTSSASPQMQARVAWIFCSKRVISSLVGGNQRLLGFDLGHDGLLRGERWEGDMELANDLL